jgi:putative transposase
MRIGIGPDTYAQRRHLPHLQKHAKTYFVTWATIRREVLADAARTIALDCCVHDHMITYWLHIAVVMPDHVHILITPYEQWSLSMSMKRVKGVSSRHINVALGRTGRLWQEESFDRILRSDENVCRVGEYIGANPVRAQLVSTPQEYPWLWRRT